MLRLRLRAILPVSFVKSEETNFDEAFFSRTHGKLVKRLKQEDVICLIASGQNILYFVHGYTEAKTKGRKPWRALFSIKMRIKRRPGLSNAFEPKMLANYARACGIELIGSKLFEEYFDYLLE